MTLFLFLTVTWLTVCAAFDLLAPVHVPGYVTWTGVAAAFGLRLAGVLAAPWWHIAAVSALSLVLWSKGALGAADSRGWFVITTTGGLSGFAWAILGEAAFMPLYKRLRPGAPVPGFPGYALGFAVWILTSEVHVHIIGVG